MNHKEKRSAERRLGNVINEAMTGLDSLQSRLDACKLAGDTKSAAKLERRIAKKKGTLQEAASYSRAIHAKP